MHILISTLVPIVGRLLLLQIGLNGEPDPTGGVTGLFSESDLEVFGAFSLVITALLWFIGYLLLQLRSYKGLYRQEVEYNRGLAEAEAERSRMALEAMEVVRETMEEQVSQAERDRQEFLRTLRQIRDRIDEA